MAVPSRSAYKCQNQVFNTCCNVGWVMAFPGGRGFGPGVCLHLHAWAFEKDCYVRFINTCFQRSRT